MKRPLITAAIAIGTFVVLTLVLGVWLNLSSQHLDSSGIPNPLTADQQDALNSAVGMATFASAAVGLVAGGLYWWRSGRAR